MRGKILLLSVLGFAAIQLSSCQKKSFDPALADAFFPLRPGLTWTYRVVDNRRGTTAIFTDHVLGAGNIGMSANADEVESEYSGPTGTLNSSIIYFPEGGYLTRQSGIGKTAGAALAERAFLPQLLKPDLTWSSSLVLFDQQPDIFHVSQTHRTFFDSRTVEVPAGHFSGCIRIETSALYQSNSSGDNLPLRLEYLDWYAPHVGLVRTVVQQSGFFASELARVELLKFGYSQLKGGTPSNAPGSSVSLQRSSLSGAAR
jgi:hypothetical protein